MADYTLLRNLPGMRRGKGFVWDLRDTREVNCDRFSDNWLTANCRTNQKLASRGKGTLRNGPEVRFWEVAQAVQTPLAQAAQKPHFYPGRK